MTRARHELIKPGSRGTFHLVTRCVHRSLLLMKGDRRAVLARGLASWLRHMGIDLLGYAIMGNHLHLVVRLRPDLVQGWSEAEVARTIRIRHTHYSLGRQRDRDLGLAAGRGGAAWTRLDQQPLPAVRGGGLRPSLS